MGSIEVIVGSMFSGKSEELIRRVKRAKIAKKKVVVYKPKIDNRYNADQVSSHNGNAEDAVLIDKSSDILKELAFKNFEIDVVAVDEIQFLDHFFVEVVNQLADRGIRVICAGLDTNFRAEPFGIVPDIMAIADKVDKLHAICVVCGNEANRTQRIVNGQPAKSSEPTVVIGASDRYEARCRKCYKLN